MSVEAWFHEAMASRTSPTKWPINKRNCCSAGVLLRLFANFGEVSERLKEHAWKACVGEILPWVQIPPSPPFLSE